jgi:hypothetical protein
MDIRQSNLIRDNEYFTKFVDQPKYAR